MRTYIRTHLRTNVRTRQDKDFNYVRTQVKIAKDGFVYVRTQVKMSKYGLFMSNRGFRKEQNMDYLCPDTSQNRKRWI